MASRSGDGGSRGSCCCGGFCKFCGFLFTVGLVVLFYWAIFQPHHIRAAVDSATLSNLTVVSSNASSAAAVSYTLAVTLSLYNPSLRVDIYYDTIAAELRFGGGVLAPAANDTSPREFHQRRKSGDDVKLAFDYAGSPGVAVGGDVAGELEKAARSGGPVSLELHMDLRVRYRFRIFKLRQKPRVWCSLSIPVKAEGLGVGGALASGDRCRVKYR